MVVWIPCFICSCCKIPTVDIVEPLCSVVMFVTWALSVLIQPPQSVPVNPVAAANCSNASNIPEKSIWISGSAVISGVLSIGGSSVISPCQLNVSSWTGFLALLALFWFRNGVWV